MGIFSGIHGVLLLYCFQIELKFGNVGFWGGRKTGGVPGENPRSRDENQ